MKLNSDQVAEYFSRAPISTVFVSINGFSTAVTLRDIAQYVANLETQLIVLATAVAETGRVLA